MKEAAQSSKRYFHTVRGKTIAEVYKAANNPEEVTDELIDHFCLQVLKDYPEIPEEDYPWMLEHVRDGVEDFLYYANWDYFKGLAEYRKNHDGKTYDENILIPEIMRAAKIL